MSDTNAFGRYDTAFGYDGYPGRGPSQALLTLAPRGDDGVLLHLHPPPRRRSAMKNKIRAVILALALALGAVGVSQAVTPAETAGAASCGSVRVTWTNPNYGFTSCTGYGSAYWRVRITCAPWYDPSNVWVNYGIWARSGNSTAYCPSSPYQITGISVQFK